MCVHKTSLFITKTDDVWYFIIYENSSTKNGVWLPCKHFPLFYAQTKLKKSCWFILVIKLAEIIVLCEFLVAFFCKFFSVNSSQPLKSNILVKLLADTESNDNGTFDSFKINFTTTYVSIEGLSRLLYHCPGELAGDSFAVSTFSVWLKQFPQFPLWFFDY